MKKLIKDYFYEGRKLSRKCLTWFVGLVLLIVTSITGLVTGVFLPEYYIIAIVALVGWMFGIDAYNRRQSPDYYAQYDVNYNENTLDP